MRRSCKDVEGIQKRPWADLGSIVGGSRKYPGEFREDPGNIQKELVGIQEGSWEIPERIVGGFKKDPGEIKKVSLGDS